LRKKCVFVSKKCIFAAFSGWFYTPSGELGGLLSFGSICRKRNYFLWAEQISWRKNLKIVFFYMLFFRVCHFFHTFVASKPSMTCTILSLQCRTERVLGG
jgi:hypothetical protein